MRRSKSRALRLALCAATLAGVGVISTIGSAAALASTPRHDGGSGVVGRLYINDNTAGVNTVAGFDRLADGALTPIPGSPFAVGGAGTGHATASQGSLQLSANGRYLLAVDAGSDQISVLRIEPDGSLQIAGGGPVSSNGPDPVSVAVYHRLVYVANAGTTLDPNPNYTGFTLHHGYLRAIPDSTVPLPAGSQPGDVLFNGNGTKLVGARVATSEIDSFTVGRDGLLTAAPGSPFAAQGVGPFGSEFRPTNPSQLFVSNAHNGGTLGTVSAFDDSADGTLSSIGSSPFADNETAPCWVEISHDGQYLFAVNTGNSEISSYAIAWNGALTLIGSTPFRNGLVGPEDARLSPDGSTLWVVESGADAVAGFSVNGGSLTELASSPTPAPVGASPSGIVVT
ncbi:MAG TPA: beta-propeller fold lactonase family protein [Acidimicrobiales bacterium]|nr:beta-propeller fold lactonase family protein [Acidimicrobiales bacterium]